MADILTSRLPASGFKSRLTSTVILLNLFIYCIAGATAYQSKHKHEKQTATSTQNLATLLDQQIKDEINSIDLALLAVKHEAEAHIKRGIIDKRGLNEYLVTQHSYLPFLQGIRILDAKGDAKYGTGGITPGVTINLAFRDYFISQRDNPKGDLFISKPILGLVAKTWIINISRRLNNPDGSFAGIVYASLTLDHYIKLFSSLKISANSSITLRDGELGLIARYPALGNTVGSQKVSEKLTAIVNAGTKFATYKARAGIDNVERTITYRKISDYPLSIIVALAEDEYLADWHKEILTMLGIVVIFTVVTLISTRMLLRRWSREQEILSDLNNARLALELRSERDRAQAYLDTVETIIVALDAEGRLTTINRKGCQVLGYQEDELKGKNWFSCCLPQPEGMESIYPLFLRFMSDEAGTALEYQEYPITLKNGELRHIAWHNAVLCDEQGVIIGFLGAGEDITERKKDEKALQESNDLLAGIIELSPISMAIVSMDGTIEQINRRTIETFGYNPDDIQTMERWWIQAYPDESYRAEVIAQWMGLVEKAIAEKSEIERREYRVTCKDGTVRTTLIFGIPVSDKVFVIFDDITDRKLAEAGRLTLERQMLKAQKLESLGILAGGIAHDFNNILTAIMGNISYARMDLDKSQHVNEPLARAEKAVKRATGLAKQLLVFAKGGDPVKKPISLCQTVNEAVSLVLSGTTVKAIIDMPPDLYAVNADEGQIGQAFDNIIINACQAMPDGGSLNITAKNVAVAEGDSIGLSAGKYVEISFCDEGCGIAAEDMERIFDPYFTNKVGGSGLGLASTYTIIKRHSGNISVNSSPGKGTTFTILIPGCGEPVYEELREVHAPDDAQGVYSILVMDDDEMVRELAEITLNRLGYTVVCCENGTTANALYRSAREEGVPFSLVIMDLTIPGGMGGVEAARQILAFDPEAQLIVSSGYSDDPVMANFSRYGFCAALEKPYNVAEIARILQRNKRG